MKKLFICLLTILTIFITFSFSTSVYASDVELPSTATSYSKFDISNFGSGNYSLADVKSGRTGTTNTRNVVSDISTFSSGDTYRLYFSTIDYSDNIQCRFYYLDSNYVWLDYVQCSVQSSTYGYYCDFVVPTGCVYGYIYLNFQRANRFSNVSSILSYCSVYRITGVNDPSPISWYNTALIVSDPYDIGINYFFSLSSNGSIWNGEGSYDTPYNNPSTLIYNGSNSSSINYNFSIGSTTFTDFISSLFADFGSANANYYHLCFNGSSYNDINVCINDVYSICWDSGGSSIGYLSWAVSNANYGSYYFGFTTNFTLSYNFDNVTPTDSTYYSRCSIIEPTSILPNYSIGLDNSCFPYNNPYCCMFWVGMIPKTNSDIVSHISSTNSIVSSYAISYLKIIDRLYSILDFDIYSKVILNSVFGSSDEWTYSTTLYIPLYDSYSNYVSSLYNPLFDFRIRAWNEIVPPAFGTYEPSDTDIWSSFTGLYHFLTSIVVFISGTGFILADINPIYTYVIALFLVLICLDMMRRFNIF